MPLTTHIKVSKLGTGVEGLCLLQFGLLLLLYQPLPTTLDTPAVDVAYNVLFAGNSVA